jgi:polysaccharide export outer membrane protein
MSALQSIRWYIMAAVLSAVSAAAAPPGTEVDSSYVLKANDVVRISVFEEADLSIQTKILQTGEAVFPLIGAVKVGGLPIRSATERIRELYAADYLVDPKVTLTVDEYGMLHVSVLGAVVSPGQILIPPSGKLDISAAIATAGGVGPTADLSRISLVRADGSTAEFALTGIEKGARIQLGAGDRVIVGESRFVNKTVTFVGEVRNRGPVGFPLDGKLDLVTATARAGGFTELANPRKVSVNRGGRVTVHDVKEMSARGDRQFRLEPDDIITVPERLF